MPEAKHTPGPWEIWEGHLSVIAGPPKQNTRGVVRGHRGTICEVVPMDVCTHEGECEEDGDPCPDALANARLIAAAPDLLAACETAMRAFRASLVMANAKDEQLLHEGYQKAKAAIAKARGEEASSDLPATANDKG